MQASLHSSIAHCYFLWISVWFLVHKFLTWSFHKLLLFCKIIEVLKLKLERFKHIFFCRNIKSFIWNFKNSLKRGQNLQFLHCALAAFSRIFPSQNYYKVIKIWFKLWQIAWNQKIKKVLSNFESMRFQKLLCIKILISYKAK